MKTAKITYNYRIWLEYNGKSLLGKGRYDLLKAIDKTNSLKKSAEQTGICKKTAHNYIRKIEKRLEEKIICSFKGGKDGGGHTKLTQSGKDLIKKYEQVEVKLR